jgi:hypothetical protein
MGRLIYGVANTYMTPGIRYKVEHLDPSPPTPRSRAYVQDDGDRGRKT